MELRLSASTATFLRLFKCRVKAETGVFVAVDSKSRVTIKEPDSEQTTSARDALLKHGTPMRLLELFYKKLNVRLVIYQGATCRYVHTPTDWDARSKQEKNTVVLNVWSHHVFTYDRNVHDCQFEALVSLRDEQDRCQYDTMLRLGTLV